MILGIKDTVTKIKNLPASFFDIKKIKAESSLEPMALFLAEIANFFDEADCGLLNNECKLQKLIINYSKKKDFDNAFKYLQVAKFLFKDFNDETARIAANSLCLPSFSFFYFKNMFPKPFMC